MIVCKKSTPFVQAAVFFVGKQEIEEDAPNSLMKKGETR
ncbi:hypothetical protein BRO54_1777 [Geobacillus proteiniphilus]|uniref:Uncharacterized protein n=1 Tax=Geobacillus proteiniphilus TaxID=860353 RepID=A0A1Q5T1G5_9BACL|nr:hypothetical protein BRO54_1777 [Geobacillus proteiniphilus]